jgi:ABC-type multidrug transport system fused ATPase/permease subunit
VKNLDFSYPGGEKRELHLADVALTIGRGERIALVGASGSGKTTLLKVIRNLYHPEEIDLQVDGVPITGGFEGICRAIALVPQDPEIFATTIKENITLGAEYDAETIRRFTDMARFTEVADSLPKKLDSAINEKGVNLSGGQRQRLALARGLLACEDKPVVLLDEPTSSIDIATEMMIYRNIFQGFSGKAILSSIHRLHLLPLFDRIYFFDQGRIIGSGTLNELLSSCPEFRDLWEQYSEGNEGIAEKVGSET